MSESNPQDKDSDPETTEISSVSSSDPGPIELDFVMKMEIIDTTIFTKTDDPMKNRELHLDEVEVEVEVEVEDKDKDN